MLKYLICLFYMEYAISHLSLALGTQNTWSCDRVQSIPLGKLCNGIIDCTNGRDETAKACISNVCKHNEYRCAYGGCLRDDKKCDGEIHCLDRSDETDFLCGTDEDVSAKIQGNCSSEEYQCKSGECIDELALCDGTPDCSDESDETVSACAHMICPNFSFRCGYGACISMEQMGNKIWDCADGSDELHAIRWESLEPKAGDGGGRRKDQPRVCKIPYENAHLRVINGRTKQSLHYHDKILPNEVVEFSCSPGFQLRGLDRLMCVNNSWYRQWPNCTKSSSSCNSHQRACDNGDCVNSDAFCNGFKNCRDGSDETPAKCLHRSCTANEFQCKYGACVEKRKYCDGVKHCADGSDETRLLCTKDDDVYYDILRGDCDSSDDEDLAQCESGECLPYSLFCDGTPNCADRSDETVQMCAHMNCTNTSFTCAYGACVPSAVHCDGRWDCVDGSDEIPEICGTIQAVRAKHEEQYNFNDNYEANIDKIEAKAENRLIEIKNVLENVTNLAMGYLHCTIPIDSVALRAVHAIGQAILKIGSRVPIGSLVQFGCKDATWQLINGVSEALCMPLGEWSGTVPKCGKKS